MVHRIVGGHLQRRGRKKGAPFPVRLTFVLLLLVGLIGFWRLCPDAPSALLALDDAASTVVVVGDDQADEKEKRDDDDDLQRGRGDLSESGCSNRHRGRRNRCGRGDKRIVLSSREAREVVKVFERVVVNGHHQRADADQALGGSSRDGGRR